MKFLKRHTLMHFFIPVLTLAILSTGCIAQTQQQEDKNNTHTEIAQVITRNISTSTPTLLPTTLLTSSATISPKAEPTQKSDHFEKQYQILRGMNIGNALEAPSPGEWSVDIRQELFHEIHSAGFNAVRIPVRFSAHTGLAPDYPINNEILEIVDKVISWGLDYNLIVILDLHHFDEIKQNPQLELTRFYSIWSQLAERYQNAPPELYFELLNEPSMNLDSDTWNQMVNESIDIIRKTNPNRKIVVGGINYYNVRSLDLLSIPPDNNLIATFHYYEPFHFTHQGASWVEGADNWRGTIWEGTPSEKQEIREALDFAVYWSNTNQIPVIMGEFGVIMNAEPLSRERWVRFIVQETEKRGISWFYWELCSIFRVYDCNNEEWDNDLLNVLIAQ